MKNQRILPWLLSFSMLPMLVNGGVLAYQDQTGVAGLQNYGCALGMDFNVNRSITITSLGAFDNGLLGNLDGRDESSGVSVQIYNVDTGLPVGPSILLTSSDPGTQIGGDAFKSVNPFVLPSGFHGSIVAFNDLNYNTGGSANSTQTLNDNQGAISFVGGGRFDGSGSFNIFPGTVDGGPANRYDAGTFIMSSSVPDGGTTVGFLGSGLLALLAFRRKLIRGAIQIR